MSLVTISTSATLPVAMRRALFHCRAARMSTLAVRRREIDLLTVGTTSPIKRANSAFTSKSISMSFFSSRISSPPSSRYYSSYSSDLSSSGSPALLSRSSLLVVEEYLLSDPSLVDPILQKSMRRLGYIRAVRYSSSSEGDDGETRAVFTVDVVLPTLLHPAREKIKAVIRDAARRAVSKRLEEEKGAVIAGSDKFTVEVSMRANRPIPYLTSPKEVKSMDVEKDGLGPGLANVSHVLAVYSCKGGVGKSTVSVNLAYALAASGGRVGLLDLDVYGPSLPVLINPVSTDIKRSSLGSNMVMPIEHNDVKVLSIGYVSENSGVPGSGGATEAAVMRGPMAGRVVTQLLKGTEWGDLDVLILDMPPGTGDVQLTVCQEVQLSGAVSVTTPSKLASADLARGVSMFHNLGVPTLAAVENMAFLDSGDQSYHHPFGEGNRSGTDLEAMGLRSEDVFQLPLSRHINLANESAVPLCLENPEKAKLELEAFNALAYSISRSLFLLQNGFPVKIASQDVDNEGFVQRSLYIDAGKSFMEVDPTSVKLSANLKKGAFVVRLFLEEKGAAMQIDVPPGRLRQTHPQTGEIMEGIGEDGAAIPSVSPTDNSGEYGHDHGTIFVEQSNQHFPANVTRKGNYGYAVDYADGATIIYNFFSIARAAGAIITKTKGSLKK